MRGLFHALTPMPQVTFDGEGLTYLQNNEPAQYVAWRQLHEVNIFTTDEGPFLDDFFWVFEYEEADADIAEPNPKRVCIIPSETLGLSLLLEQIGVILPGFDFEATIKASTSTENAVFLCWLRG